jgi:hypothetical protein
MLPAEFWQAEREKLAAIIRPQLYTLALSGALAAMQDMNKVGLFVNDDLVNTDAVQWARQHTDTLLNQLGTTSNKLVGEAIASWAETPGATMGDLEKVLKPILDDNQIRAWRVSVTETTRAYAEGNNLAHIRAGIPEAIYKPPAHPNCYCRLVVARLTSSNEWVQRWETNNDEKVCRQPLNTPWGTMQGCRAMHGRIVSSGAHSGQLFSEANRGN